jgi:chromosome segregation ATPase
MMCKIEVTRFLAALFLALALGAQGFAQSPGTKPADTCESATSKAQENNLSNLDILARAEQRAETLRARLLDLQMQELNLQARLDDLDYRLLPDSLQQAIAFIGSARPMDELREAVRRRLENEKARVNKQMEILISSRERIEAAINRADAEIERLRQQLELP